MARLKKTNDSVTRSRALYACPNTLENVIHWANQISPDVPLPSFTGLSDFWLVVQNKLHAVATGIGGLNRDTKDEHKRMEVWELIKLSEAGSKYIDFIYAVIKLAADRIKDKIPMDRRNDGFFFTPELIDEFISIYEKNRDSIIFITNLAKSLNDTRTGKQSKNSWVFPLEVFLFIDTNNKINFSSDNFLFSELKGIDFDRIRLCEICGNIFWAKRKDKETCSARCLKNLTVRRVRNLSPEEKERRKEQREANRRISRIRETIRKKR